jgi:exodeoxyribonuclease VII large subunit
LANQLRRLSPEARLRGDRQRLDELAHRAATLVGHTLQLKLARLTAAKQRLHDLNPKSILTRGYAIVSQPDGVVVRSRAQVQQGDALNVRLSDGEFDVEVTDIDEH